MVKIADAGEQSIFVRHLSPNHIPFKRGGLLGKSLLCRPPAAFLTFQKGHVKTNVIKRVFKVLFKACWLFCRGFWSCRIRKFDCSSAMTQNFAAGSHQRGHTGNWGLLCGCLAWVGLNPLWFSLQCMNTVHCCCPLKCVEVCAWWCLYHGTIYGAWGNSCAQETAMSLAAQARPLCSMELTLSSAECDA